VGRIKEATISQLKSNVPKQKITAAEKQKEIEALAANLKEQASQIRKVNDKVELNKSTPQKVASDR
jgi:HAMP domain-containing protein